MNLTYFTVPSFKKKQIVATEGNDSTELAEVKGNADQPLVVMHQSRPVGTARRAVRWRCLPARSPRRGDPTFPGSVVTDPLPFVAFVSFCSKSLFLAGALLFFGLATSVQAQFTYTTNNGTITITGYTGSGGAVTIPSTITGLPVTDIGTNAFIDCEVLTSVTIPNSVTSIGNYAFEACDHLASVVIGNGVTNIGYGAFGNSGLTSVTIPGSVITVGAETFDQCFSLANVTISLGVTSIESNAFEYCNALTSVTIPESVTNLGAGVFAYSALTALNVASNNPAYSSVAGVLFNKNQTALIEYPDGLSGSYNIPLGVTDIESNAFYNCYSLFSVTIPDSVTNIGDYAFYGCFNLTNVSIPDSVTSIGAYAFHGCNSLTNVVLDSGLVSIGAYAFSGTLCYGCGLTTIAIPASVTNIGTGAFSDDPALTAINVASNNPAYTTLNGVLFDKTLTTLLEYPGGLGGSYTIPAGVTTIESNAFYNSDVASVTIPDTVTNVGDHAFYNCYSLTNVVLDSGLVSIGAYAFSGTISTGSSVGFAPAGCPITSIIIPNSVTTIGDFAFWFCNLTNILISSGVTNMGDGAFGGCPLPEIDVVPGNPAYTSLAGVLFNHDQSTLVEFPCGLGGSYTIPNSVTNIGDYAFYDCASLTNVVLDNNLISIGAYAFSGPVSYGGPGVGPDFSLTCPLTSITVPANVTTIGAFAFSGSPSLTNAYFLGNAPDADSTVFSVLGALGETEAPRVSAYYLPGTTGWAEFTTNTGVPTALWTLPYPLILNSSSGVRANQFVFTISWATNVPVVVEASTDLSKRVWTPIATNTLTGGASFFSDPQWTNYPARFYRIRSR